MRQVVFDRKNKETLTKQQRRNKETYKVRCKLLSKNLPNHNFWRENDLTRKGRKLEGRISAVTAF